jgi:argininosuccinate lyase
MSQLWNKGYNINQEILRFTVGNDYTLDQLMIPYDIYGSIAQAAMLKKIGILTPTEFKRLHTALIQLLKHWQAGKFQVQPQDEDGHTAIENYLVRQLGDLGKKIHTARSRNDQVVTMTRLYMKDMLLGQYQLTLAVIAQLLKLAKRYEFLPMPGYTHMQRAMPMSAGMWFDQYAEALLDDLKLLEAAYHLNNMSPLGSAAGFGVNLNIDRLYTAQLLGFERVQNNSVYVSYTRGKVEAAVLFSLNQLMGTFAKFSNDILMFSMSETGFVELPREFCTGSSLMPQKRNGDVFELTRGKANVMLGYLVSTIELQNTLLSGYNRDTQLTKDLLVNGLNLYDNTAKVMLTVASGIRMNKQKCLAACSADIFATDYALDLVKQGVPFRDAYRQVAASLDKLEQIDPEKNIRSKRHLGATGNLGLAKVARERQTRQRWCQAEQRRWIATQQRLLAPGGK